MVLCSFLVTGKTVTTEDCCPGARKYSRTQVMSLDHRSQLCEVQYMVLSLHQPWTLSGLPPDMDGQGTHGSTAGQSLSFVIEKYVVSSGSPRGKS
jgi:hypothetical protein